MRIPLLSALVAGAALVQVGASPIRLEIVSSSDEIPARLRYGHAFSGSNVDASRIRVATVVRTDSQITNTKLRTHCKGMKARLQQKAIELSNAFRQALGLPIIEPQFQAPESGFVHIMPVGPPSFVNLYPTEQDSNGHPHHHPHPHPPHGHHGHHRKRPGCHKRTSFLRRIHVALTALGPWEGRVVAFVLGCGIGVLLRMMWVLAIVSYRTIKGGNDTDNEYTEIVFVEEIEELDTPAPAYTDEKTEAAPAPVATTTN